MTNSVALKCTVSPGPTSPTPAECNTVTAGSRQKKWSRHPSGPPPSILSKKARWPLSSRHCRSCPRWQSATKLSRANATEVDSKWRRSDGSGSGLHQSRSHLGIRTVEELANSVAARVGRSVMAHVFRPRPSNRCPKTIVPVVVVVVGEPSGVSAARSLPEPSGRLLVRNRLAGVTAWLRGHRPKASAIR
jgi:hypothetical protein